MKLYKSISGWLYALKRGNWKVIFLCIVTATTFWFFRSLNGEYTTRLNYPIYFEYNRDSLIAVQALPERLLIDVTSGGWNLLRKTYALDNIPVSIELENPVATRFLAGAVLFPVVDQISDLRLNYVVTDTVFIKLETRISRVVGLELDSTTFSFAPNHRITSPMAASTDTLLFTGPTSMIEALPDPFLVMLPFSDIEERFDNDVILSMDSTPLIKVQPPVFQLTFDVEEFILQSTEVSLKTLNFPEDGQVSLRDSVVKVFYRVKESLATSIADTSIEVTTNLENLNYSDSTIIPRIVAYPDFLEELYLEPLQVKVVHGN